MTTPASPPVNRVYFFLVLTTLLWGGSFLFTKIGVSAIPPQLFVLTRFTLATTIMLLVCSTRLKNMNTGILTRGMIVGIALGLTNMSFVFGIQGTSISRAGILNNLFVLFIPVITKIVWRDRIGLVNVALYFQKRYFGASDSAVSAAIAGAAAEACPSQKLIP